MRPATYAFMEQLLKNALYDLAILAGDIVGPSDVSWQDVAGTAAVNLQVLASQLDQARNGQAEPGIVFPSPAECLPGEVRA
jgi:hypothetical protein